MYRTFFVYIRSFRVLAFLVTHRFLDAWRLFYRRFPRRLFGAKTFAFSFFFHWFYKHTIKLKIVKESSSNYIGRISALIKILFLLFRLLIRLSFFLLLLFLTQVLHHLFLFLPFFPYKESYLLLSREIARIFVAASISATPSLLSRCVSDNVVSGGGRYSHSVQHYDR